MLVRISSPTSAIAAATAPADAQYGVHPLQRDLYRRALPDGTHADAVYLVLSEPYREVLNHAPVRPLDYAYLKDLTPMAQRFYELVSYKMFAALKHRHPHATLRYGDYCLFSTQQRYTEATADAETDVQGPSTACAHQAISQGPYEATTDADGQPDWLLQYTPGPKAHAEYTTLSASPAPRPRRLFPPAMDADQEALRGTVTRKSLGAPPSPRRRAAPRRGRADRSSSTPRPHAQHRRPTDPSSRSPSGGAPHPPLPADPLQAQAAPW